MVTGDVQAHDKDINAIAVAPNDKLFASASQDRTAKLWSVTNGSCTVSFFPLTLLKNWK